MAAQLAPRERARLEHLLRLNCDRGDARVVEARDVCSALLRSRFEERIRVLHQRRVIDVFVEAALLTAPNGLQRVIDEGFRVAKRGLVFPHGQVQLPPGQAHRLLHCLLAVGRSYCAEAGEVQAMTETVASSTRALPTGFDSFRLLNVQLAASGSTPGGVPRYAPSEGYYAEYVVFDSAQVLPCAVLVCDPGGAGPERTPAAAGSPRREVLDPDRVPRFWDSKWKVAVSVHDKMLGTHAVGDAATHPLMPVEDAVRATLDTPAPEPASVRRYRAALNARRAELARMQGELVRNTEAVEREIYANVQATLERLRELSTAKQRMLVSDLAELERQQGALTRAEAFAKRHALGASAAERLSHFHETRRAAAEIAPAELELFARWPPVVPDIVLSGALAVESASAAEADAAATQARAEKATQPVGTDEGEADGEYDGARASPHSLPSLASPLNSPGAHRPTWDAPPSAGAAGAHGRANGTPGLLGGPLACSPYAQPRGWPLSPACSAAIGSSGMAHAVGGRQAALATPGAAEPRSSGIAGHGAQPTLASPPPGAASHAQAAPSLDPWSPAPAPHALTDLSLRGAAERHEALMAGRRSAARASTGPAPFDGSAILSAEQASVLFAALALPSEPITALLFSSRVHGRSVRELHAKCDGRGPTVVLCSARGHHFGGFASTPWNSAGVRFGARPQGSAPARRCGPHAASRALRFLRACRRAPRRESFTRAVPAIAPPRAH